MLAVYVPTNHLYLGDVHHLSAGQGVVSRHHRGAGDPHLPDRRRRALEPRARPARRRSGRRISGSETSSGLPSGAGGCSRPSGARGLWYDPSDLRRRFPRRQMLHMLRSRSGCLAGLLAALLWTSTIAPLGAQAPEPAAQQTPARHAGGEANLILPDLGSGRLPGHQRPHAADRRPRRLRARTGVRHGHLRAAAEPAGAPLDARDLRADLRDVQDLPDHAGQVHPAPRAVHRRDHGLLLRRAAALRRGEGRRSSCSSA